MRVELPVSEYVRDPNADVPSERSDNVNVHAPLAPGTKRVGESDVETHDDGVTSAPNQTGVRSPVADPDGNAGRSTGLPPVTAAERDEDDSAQAAATIARVTKRTKTDRRVVRARTKNPLGVAREVNIVDISFAASAA
jgi:hypothetical protein